MENHPYPLVFSTLGCPGSPPESVAALARTTGWHGLELRAAQDEHVHIGITSRERRQVRETLLEGGARPLVVASYVEVASDAISDRACVVHAVAHAELAADLGCRFVRVFPGGDTRTPQTPHINPESDARAVRRLREIALALPDGVDILLETHDSHPRGVDIARVLRAVDHPRIGAIWDALHPWRHGEDPAATAALLAPWLAHVQLKDCAGPADLTPAYLGSGSVPLAEVLAALGGMAYAGAISLEWEAKWYPDAPPLAEALVRGRAWLAAQYRALGFGVDADPAST